MYNSWRTYQQQVSGYSNNSYEEFETFDKAHHHYSIFLNEENSKIGHEVGDNFMMADEVQAQMPIELQPSRIKDFIIIVLLVVIVKLVLF